MSMKGVKVGDIVKLKPHLVEEIRLGRYAKTVTVTDPTPVEEVTTSRFGLKRGAGAILVGGEWRWADDFEIAGGPW